MPTDSRVKRSIKKDLLLELFEFVGEGTSVPRNVRNHGPPSTAIDPGKPE